MNLQSPMTFFTSAFGAIKSFNSSATSVDESGEDAISRPVNNRQTARFQQRIGDSLGERFMRQTLRRRIVRIRVAFCKQQVRVFRWTGAVVDLVGTSFSLSCPTSWKDGESSNAEDSCGSANMFSNAAR